MLRISLMLYFTLVFAQSASAAIENEIAAIDRVMVRACQVAEINATSAKKDRIESFLRVLSLLETQFKNAGDQDGLLACRKVRGNYDPTAEKVDQPTELPPQLVALVSGLEKQLSDIERNRTKTIVDAKNGRARKLTALQRGLIQRGDKAGAQRVFAALKSTPAIPKAVDPAQASAAQDVIYLTYIRAKKRWEKMDGEGVRREVSGDTTTLHYEEGTHFLLKALWPDVLEIGERFSVEVKGAFSVEVVELDGADANARFSLPESDTFIKVEIARERDKITFVCDGEPQKSFYASGKLRGDEARAAMSALPLRAVFSVKKGEQASFHDAVIIKP